MLALADRRAVASAIGNIDKGRDVMLAILRQRPRGHLPDRRQARLPHGQSSCPATHL